MIKPFLTTFLVGALLNSFAQSNFKRNDLYLEAGGNGLFGSVNYERQLTKEPGIGARIGVGFYTENAFYLTIPVGINYLFALNPKNAFLDAGLGTTFAWIDSKVFGDDKYSNGEHFTSFIPSIGYRKHTDKNVMWRVSVSPVINNEGFVPWIGFSIGKRF
jgi:hypothetical protein